MTSLEKRISKIQNKEELIKELPDIVKNFKTIFNKTYTDYDSQFYTDHVKIYEGDVYLLVDTEYNQNAVDKINVIVSKNRPRTPITVFPLIRHLMPNEKVYTFE